jgi:hypothetical protein
MVGAEIERGARNSVGADVFACLVNTIVNDTGILYLI